MANNHSWEGNRDLEGRFFHTEGGAVPPEAKSYIERESDSRLLETLLGGTHCCVLDSRQMGKTSLIARTAVALRKAGVTVAAVDISVCGENVAIDEWYRNQLSFIGADIGLEDELLEFFASQHELSPVKRYGAAMQHALALIPPSGRIVVFLDEIDFVRNVKEKTGFSTDELFAAIRGFHNDRAINPEMRRLTYCLVGAALPNDLISGPDVTPFNIGARINLSDFTEKEVMGIGEGLRKPAEVIPMLVRRILYWTGGQPFLTQALCHEVAEDQALRTSAGVDHIVKEKFLKAGSLVDEHYTQVSKRLLSENYRSENLSLYRELLRERQLRLRFGALRKLLFDRSLVSDDDTKMAVNGLHVSGIAKGKNGYLMIRNELYARRFNIAWTHEHMLGPEEVAAEKAYYRGLRYALLAAFSVISLVALLAATFVIERLAADNRDKTALYRRLQGADQNLRVALLESQKLAEEKKNALDSAVVAGKDAAHERDLAKARAVDLAKSLSARNTLDKELTKRNSELQDKIKVIDEQKQQLTVLTDKLKKESDINAEKEKQASAAREGVEAELSLQNKPWTIKESIAEGINSLQKSLSYEGDHALRNGLLLLPKKQGSWPMKAGSGWYRVSGNGQYIFTVGATSPTQLTIVRSSLSSKDDTKSITFPREGPWHPQFGYPDASGDYLILSGSVSGNQGQPDVGSFTSQALEFRATMWNKANPEGGDQPGITACGRSTGRGGFYVAGSYLFGNRCDGKGLVVQDLQSGIVRVISPKNAGKVFARPLFLAASPDGKLVVQGVIPKHESSIVLIRSFDVVAQKWLGESRIELSSLRLDPFDFLNPPDVTVSSQCRCILVRESLSEVGAFHVFTLADSQLAVPKDFSFPAGATATFATFSSDGKKILVGSSDGDASIYDAGSLKEGRRFSHISAIRSSGTPIRSLALSTDGTKLLSYTNDLTARVWDVKTGLELSRIPVPSTTRSVTLTGNADRVAVLSYTESAGYQVASWDVKGGVANEVWKSGVETNFVGIGIAPKALIAASVTVPPTGMASIYSFDSNQLLGRAYADERFVRAAVSNDGTRFATISESRNIDVRETETGKILYQISVHTLSPDVPSYLPSLDNVPIMFSDSGRYLAIGPGLGRKLLFVLDIQNRQVLQAPDPTRELNPHGAVQKSSGAKKLRTSDDEFEFSAPQFNESGDSLLFAYSNRSSGGLYSWNLQDGKVQSISGFPDGARCLLAQKGNRFVCIEKENINVYSLNSEGARQLQQWHQSLPGSWDLSLSGRYLIPKGRGNGAPVVFDLETGYKFDPDQNQNSATLSGAWEVAGDGQFVRIDKKQGTLGLSVLNPTSKEESWNPIENIHNSAEIESLLGRRIAIGDREAGRLFVFDLENLHSPPLAFASSDNIAFSADENAVAAIAGSVDLSSGKKTEGAISGFRLGNGLAEPVTLYPNGLDRNPITAIAMDNSGTVVAIGQATNSRVRIGRVSYEGGKLGLSLSDGFSMPYAPRQIAFSADGKYLAAAAQNQVDIGPSTGDGQKRELPLPDRVMHLAFAANKPFIAFATATQAYIYDAESGRDLGSISESGTIAGLAVSDSYLALASRQNNELSLEIYKIDSNRGETVRQTFTFPKKIASVTSMAFNKDSTRLAVATEEGNVYLWEFGKPNSEEAIVPLQHDTAVRSVEFSPGPGSYLMAAGRGEVHIWDWEKGIEVARIAPDPNLSTDTDLSVAKFSFVNEKVVIVSQSGTIEVVPWEKQDIIREACARLDDAKPPSCDAPSVQISSGDSGN